MNLADRITQCAHPFVISDNATGQVRVLNNAADFAQVLPACAVRYVLSDDLTRLCADLAYSHGTRSLLCADLLRVPATSLWIEWSNQPWEQALQRYGFSLGDDPEQWAGRRGALLSATLDGRRGLLRTFWSSPNTEPSASSMEAYFDFDVEEDEDPRPPDGKCQKSFRVRGDKNAEEDLLSRCFRFRFEQTWANYYAQSGLSDCERSALWQHSLGTIAVDIPMLTAFLLLLSVRNALPQLPRSQERLNAARRKAGKHPLLDHIEVRAPLMPAYQSASGDATSLSTRRSPRLHHVRGHLMRRGFKLIWRVPHMRGSVRAGARLPRTVTWTVDTGRGADTHQP